MIHLITGEYPPVPGGVSDYCAAIAVQMADRGQRVEVWTGGNTGTSQEGEVTVHRMAGGFCPVDLARLDSALNQMPGPRRLLVQWTPHSYGYRSLNQGVAAWFWKRAKINHDRVELMVHEPFVAFERGNWRRNAAAAVHRLMMATLLDAAAHVWIAIPAWEKRLRPWCFGKAPSFGWLPVPSNIGGDCEARSAFAIRSQLAPERQPIVGHFGTYRADIAPLLEAAIMRLLEISNVVIHLTGFGSTEFANRFPTRFESRISATGALSHMAVAGHLSACDVLLQPYPDGISSRRGSAMAALALGMPMVTNLGHLSEEFWVETHAVEIALSSHAKDLANATLSLIQDRDLRMLTSGIARDLYRTRFDIQHSVAQLLDGYESDFARTSKAVA